MASQRKKSSRFRSKTKVKVESSGIRKSRTIPENVKNKKKKEKVTETGIHKKKNLEENLPGPEGFPSFYDQKSNKSSNEKGQSSVKRSSRKNGVRSGVTFNDMPPEVKCAILKWLPLEDKLKFRLTNKTWDDILGRFLKLEPGPLNDDNFETLQQTKFKFQQLTVHSLEEFIEYPVLQYGHNIRKLIFKLGRVRYGNLGRIFKSCLNVEVIQIISDRTFENTPYISEIEIPSTLLKYMQCLHYCKNLVKLEIFCGREGVSDSGSLFEFDCSLLSRCKKLTTVNIRSLLQLVVTGQGKLPKSLTRFNVTLFLTCRRCFSLNGCSRSLMRRRYPFQITNSTAHDSQMNDENFGNEDIRQIQAHLPLSRELRLSPPTLTEFKMFMESLPEILTTFGFEGGRTGLIHSVFNFVVTSDNYEYPPRHGAWYYAEDNN